MTAQRSATGPTGTVRRSALVYGDVDLNLIDGSAIWARASSRSSRGRAATSRSCSRRASRPTRLVAPLDALPNVRIVRPFEEGLRVTAWRARSKRAATLLGTRCRAALDIVVARGLGSSNARPRRRFDGRLWTYLTDIPQAVTDLTTSRSRGWPSPTRRATSCVRPRSCGASWSRPCPGPSGAASFPAEPPRGRPAGPTRRPGRPAQARLRREVRAALEHRGDDPPAGPARRAGRGRGTARHR